MEILFRLMEKQEDGSFKVVGYEKQENHKLYGWFDTYVMGVDKNAEWKPISFGTIRCHRKDMYTGIDIDGVKVFENDNCVIGDESSTVKFINGSWTMLIERPRVDFIQDMYRNIKYARIAGISGVTNEES